MFAFFPHPLGVGLLDLKNSPLPHHPHPQPPPPRVLPPPPLSGPTTIATITNYNYKLLQHSLQ